MRYLAVIPARGGSKRLPGKNVRPMMGEPLIYWSIKACMDAVLLDDFVVSTEDAGIKQVSACLGARVVNRPAELATDAASVVPALIHAMSNSNADALVMIQPTSPIRVGGILDQCITTFEAEAPDSLSTGFNCVHFEWGTMPSMASQLMRPFFYNDGCVEIHRREVVMAGTLLGELRHKFLVPQHYSHEIDSEIDFIEVEATMKHLKRAMPDDKLWR